MPILTAGYGNRGFEAFVALMKRHEVTHVVDVRSVPQSSYWEDFRRERLRRILPEAGLKYVYMGDTLGGQGSGEKPAIFCKVDPSAIDLKPLFDDPKFHLGLSKLVEAAAVPGRTICLMCGCLRPQKCHRSRLIGPALTAQGVEVLHLDAMGNPITQEQVARESEPLQNALIF